MGIIELMWSFALLFLFIVVLLYGPAMRMAKKDRDRRARMTDEERDEEWLDKQW